MKYNSMPTPLMILRLMWWFNKGVRKRSFHYFLLMSTQSDQPTFPAPSAPKNSRWKHRAAILLYSSFGAVLGIALSIGFVPYKDIVVATEKAVPDQDRGNRDGSSFAFFGPLQDTIDDIEDKYDLNIPAILGLASMLGIFLLFLFALILTSMIKCTMACKCCENNKRLRSQRFEVAYRVLLGLTIPIYIPVYLVHGWTLSFFMSPGSLRNVLWGVGCYMGIHALVLGMTVAFVMIIGPPMLYSEKPSLIAILYVLSAVIAGSVLFALIIIDGIRIGIPYSDLKIVCSVHVPIILVAYTLLYVFTVTNQDGCKMSCRGAGRASEESKEKDANAEELNGLLDGSQGNDNIF